VTSSNHIDGDWMYGTIHSNSRCDVPYANERKYKKLVWEEVRKGSYIMLNDSSILVLAIHKWIGIQYRRQTRYEEGPYSPNCTLTHSFIRELCLCHSSNAYAPVEYMQHLHQ